MEESYPLVLALMFIGGGSASTAGGIKVATFFLLAFVIWAELRGEPDVTVGRRRVAAPSQRQAFTVALLSVALVAVGTLLLIFSPTGVPFYAALFEVTSAFTTTGLSVGLAASLPENGQLALIILMFVGRIGPADPRVGARPEHPPAAVPLPGGATRCRLGGRTRAVSW